MSTAMFEKTFPHREGDDFSAYAAAERWCKAQGYSTGSMQRGAPTWIFKGDCDVAKDRNLSGADKAEAIGRITGTGGRFRGGPVTVTITGEKALAHMQEAVA